MAEKMEIAGRLLAALSAGAGDGLADLLGDDVRFRALNVDLAGKPAVSGRLTGEAGLVYRGLAWEAPREAAGGAVEARGRLANGAQVILTLHFAGGRLVLIQHQMIPGRGPAPDELKLPAELKALVDNALKSRHPMLIAYADEDQPVLSFRGSTQAFSDTQLAIWVRNGEGRFIRAIARNPKVALMYRDEDSKATFQFQGRARVESDEAARRRIYEHSAEIERDHDFARAGVAVVIDLDRVEGYAGLSPKGPLGVVRMARGAGPAQGKGRG